MALLEALRKNDYNVLLPGINGMQEEQDKLFQEILQKVQDKFQELQETDTREIKKNNVSRKKRVTSDIVDKPTCNDSVCTTDLKEPLGTSTPTDSVTCASSEKENQVQPRVAKPVPVSEFPKTPASEFKCPISSESVKKRIEAFEKRTQAVALSASKTHVPVKKNIVSCVTRNLSTKQANEPPEKSKNYIEKVLKPRITRNTSKVLQDKNTNIKPVREKSQDIVHKKIVVKKASSVCSEDGKKKKELVRKANLNAAKGSKRETATKQLPETKTHVIQENKESQLEVEPLKKKQLSYIVPHEPKRKIQVKPSKKEEGKSYNIDNVQDGASTDDEENPSQEIPSWAKKENRKHQLCAQAYLDKNKTIFRWFYNRRLKHPIVEELFSAGVKTRPRTSSAVWN